MAEMKTAIITGATGAIGTAIARQILAGGDHDVIMVAKNEAKAKIICQLIKRETGRENIRWEKADLSRKREVENLTRRVKGPVHLLVNNAACAPRQRLETPEGIEMQFAVNVLGYFWMIQAFQEQLRAGVPSRIVNVASYWAGGLDLADLEFKSRRYNNNEAYRQSKQADRMLTVAFAKRLRPFGINVNACHPGDVNSGLSNDLGFGGHETPDQGARTPVWLALSEETAGTTGGYFENRKEALCQFTRDKAAIEKLWGICAGY
jgi:NAD(P)-dependent dehydrogenase (short-subunit alcohol dehydrogenase family)